MMFYDILPKNLEAIKNIFSSLRSRNYRIYFTGQGISLVGTWMQNIALSWLVYRLTGSVFLLGLVGFTSQIPTFVLAPFTGVLTDRYSRLKIMILAQVFFMLQALTMAMLVLFNLIEVWHIIALSLVFGIISAFDAPARQSLVIDLIDNRADLGNAIALNSAIFNGARLVGPAIAGITIAAVGEGICFLLNTFSFVAVIIALLRIKIPIRQKPLQTGNFKESFKEGLQYTFHSMPIRTLILLLAILSLVGLPFIVLLPAYAKEILHGSSDTLGFLMSAMGAGALTGALYMATRKTVLGLGRIISLNSILLGVAIVLLSFSEKLHFSLIVFFFGGLSMILLLSAINTMLQTIADEDKRGRVMSFYAMALMGISPIGNLFAGTIASGIGISYTLLIGGTVTLLSGLWFEMNRKSLRKYVRPIYINKGILPGIPHEVT
ncbi:MAG: MFS transporter [Bacteroidales bacterium]|jgi:MFS family permease|nr:MFS transporter [Bacteroidales bacterium]